MGIPGFYAERSVRRHATIGGLRRFDNHAPGHVALALGGPESGSFAGCVMDCQDQHPNWTVERCRSACRDSGLSGPVGPSNPTNVALSEAGCWSFYVACMVNPFGFGCAEVRDRCLADIRR
jgi:hypothetical protein